MKKRIAAIAFTTAIVLAIVITGFALLTSPQYLPYSEEILTLTEAGNGMLICSFSDEVTGYTVQDYLSDDGETSVYHISTWNTTWDMAFSKNGQQNAALEPNSETPKMYKNVTVQKIVLLLLSLCLTISLCACQTNTDNANSNPADTQNANAEERLPLPS